MITNFYIPFAITTVVLVAILGGLMISIFIWSERLRKKDDEKMASFMRFAHMESQQSRKEARKILHEIQKTNHDNGLFLRMIFERVDRPPEEI
ncbi:MAG: hypothetical protein OEV66_04770 [Spirochaetia bacterium]|nr:hypothetical protein [Spirochaetia bacterium]